MINYEITIDELKKIEKNIPIYKKTIFFDKTNKYALLIPVINEGERFVLQMNKMKNANIFDICDVFICDGGSEEEYFNSNFIMKYGCRGLIINTSNIKGQGTQLKQGYYEVMKDGYDGVITCDGNNKDNIDESLTLFIAKLEDKFDVIQSTRFTLGGKEENTPLLRKIGIRLIASPLFSMASGFHYDDITNGYKAFSRKYILDSRLNWFRDDFCTYEHCYFPLLPVKKLGYSVCQVPTSRIYPKSELPSKIKGFSSNFNFFKLLLKLIFLNFKIKK
ncbi:glycosyltransferase family 2 protein [Brachyspira sp.]|uniref:glycosyltransferase family 2 protein n=1 Tax=Brachyspira sp. TaxID=1977261 RepID=UPI00260405FF|nr:glycosyltransferase family 2 protein [Brachyspira sp.]